MSERAQIDAGPIRLFVVLSIVLLVGAIVAQEAVSQVAAVDGPVEYCGLCHVEWWRFGVLLVVLAVHAVIIREYWLTGGEGDDA